MQLAEGKAIVTTASLAAIWMIEGLLISPFYKKCGNDTDRDAS